jgi:hypothetical protein
LSYSVIKTYAEACSAVEQLGILPLSNYFPDHPSLETLTDPSAWHTGALTDPWLWRDRFATEGVAAYGRFLSSRPLLIARDTFPLVKCLLTPSEHVEERYAAGLLARSTLQIYSLIEENDGIDVRALRKQAGMEGKANKNAFDHTLIDLQNSAEIVISGISERLNDQGNKSGWNSTCYILAERWMEQHKIAPSQLTPTAARAQLFAWLKPRWKENALLFLEKKLPRS